MAYKSSNPVISDAAYKDVKPVTKSEAMTTGGTIRRALFLLLLVVGGAFYSWDLTSRNPELFWSLFYPLLIGGLIVGLIAAFSKRTTKYLSPVYAVLEGLFLGGVSYVYNDVFEGIVVQAIGLTFAIFFAMLLVYSSGLIKVTEKFKIGVFAATLGIMLFYLVSIVLRVFFNIEAPLIHESTPLGIAFSVFVVGIASLNLVIDFDFIQQGVEKKLPKNMEWYGAFGLIVTLVWLYLEVLRLLSKIRR